MARTPRIAISKSKNHPASFELYTPSERTREDQGRPGFFSALGPTTHVLNVFLLKSNPIMDSHGVYEVVTGFIIPLPKTSPFRGPSTTH
jgi:hypothetical protein